MAPLCVCGGVSPRLRLSLALAALSVAHAARGLSFERATRVHIARASHPRAHVLAEASPLDGDRVLLDAVRALQRGSPEEASALLRSARQAYGAGAGGPSASQSALLEEIDARVRRALGAPPPPDPPAARVVLRSLPGDKLVQEAVRLFNAKKFGQAREAIHRARESFAAEDASVARDRSAYMQNLYGQINCEEERQAHARGAQGAGAACRGHARAGRAIVEL
ncbi:hypothetical protein T492DRAFT_1013849, partial [Pavlovales sp. CCMP2436]